MNLFIKKINNLINFSVSFLIDKLIKLKSNNIVPGTLLIVKLDSIGDYVLFRNFLQVIRESKKFSGYKITLCGNIIWKDLSECLDSKYVDNFIWLDRNKFYTDIFFRYSFLKKIHSYGFEISIDPTYSREILFGDTIIRAASSIERTGSSGALEKHAKWKRTLFSDNVYTRRIEASKENLFEFYRNREFFENYFGEKLTIDKPFIDTSAVLLPETLPEGIFNNKFVVLFPGAGAPFRMWSKKYFIETARFILKNYDYNIIILGSMNEQPLASFILNEIKSSRLYNLAGSLNLCQLAKLLSDALLLISNETGAVHFSAAVNLPVICISNGSFKGRFHPYPDEVFSKAHYIYPPEINKNDGTETGEDSFRYLSSLNVNSIEPLTVINKIKEILK